MKASKDKDSYLTDLPMRFKTIYLILLIVVFSACRQAEDNKPDNILTRDQMAQILPDVQLAEAAIANKNLWGDSAKKYASDCYAFVFKQHRIDKKLFESSLNYYLLHPKDLDLIYTDVISELSLKEAQEAK